MKNLIATEYSAIREEPRIGPAYILWGLLGVLGAHRHYCRRPGGYAQGGLFAGGVLTLIGVAGVPLEGFFAAMWAIWTALGGLGAVAAAVLWMLVDGLLIPGWMRKG